MEGSRRKISSGVIGRNEAGPPRGTSVFARLAAQQPQCGFGAAGLCCRACYMGPCCVDPLGPGPKRGVCGADANTIVARNFLRAVAAGVSAHADHAREVAETFVAVARGEAPDFAVTDRRKLLAAASEWGVKARGRSEKAIALDLGQRFLAEFGKPSGSQRFVGRAPARRRAIWEKLGLVPRAVDREVVESLHRSTMGVDQDWRSLVAQASRVALADGWGGSMIATELQDILFGTPAPARGKVSLGVLRADSVNIVVHGHEALLAEMVVKAAALPEASREAKEAGARGVNVVGICCTGTELLARHGVPVAGSFLSQEIAVATGAVDAMCVDVQCVMQGLGELVRDYHTRLVTTSAKGRIAGVEHIPLVRARALDAAKRIVRIGIEAFGRRRHAVRIPGESRDAVVGFSHDSIAAALGPLFPRSARPLNDAIVSGRIRGIVAVVGCTNPKGGPEFRHDALVRELLRRDLLVVTTGCAQISCGKTGLLTPEAAAVAGPGLREICERAGIPPVLAMGSCVDNTRILAAASTLVRDGGLGDDIADLPLAAACLEHITEKAIAIGQYFVASGLLVLFSRRLFPLAGGTELTDYLSGGIADDLGGRWALEDDPLRAAEVLRAHVESKRAALNLDGALEFQGRAQKK